jgi:hypothetical protein
VANIQDDILESFYTRLSETQEFSKEKIEAFRNVFGSNKKPKAADVIKVLSEKSDKTLP